MNFEMGNKNVVAGFLVLMLFLSMSFFIERTSALHQFHEKASAAVVETKGTSDLLDDQVIDMKRGPAYRTGGIYFTNHYPNSYVRVFNSGRDAAYNLRWYEVVQQTLGVNRAAGTRYGDQYSQFTVCEKAVRIWGPDPFAATQNSGGGVEWALMVAENGRAAGAPTR